MRVAIVEDNDDLAMLAAHLLRSLGYEVITLVNTPTLLDMRSYEGVDVAIVDLMMPEVSGETILEFLKGRVKKLIVWTAKPIPLVNDRVKELADFIVQKGGDGSLDLLKEALES